MAFIPATIEIEKIEPIPITITIDEPKKKKRFADYYAEPEYKARHLAHMMTKIPCSGCGLITSRSNMSKHRKSRRHQQVVASMQNAIVKKELDVDKLKDVFLQLIKSYQAAQ